MMTNELRFKLGAILRLSQKIFKFLSSTVSAEIRLIDTTNISRQIREMR